MAEATYDEVIELIRRSPPGGDISLLVRFVGRIPVQESAGQRIQWLSTLPPDRGESEQQEGPGEIFCPIPQTGGGSPRKPAACSPLSSAESGLERDANNSAHWADDSLASSSTGSGQAEGPAGSPSSAASLAGSTGGGASSATGSSSGCSASISLSISSPNSAELERDGDEVEVGGEIGGEEEKGPSQADRLVRVPGGRLTSEPFGCGVVKGPDQWPGIFVQNVKPDSLAQRVGLEPGDQLLRAEGRPLAELPFERAIELIKELQAKRDELLLLVRKGAALRHLASSRRQAGDGRRQPVASRNAEGDEDGGDYCRRRRLARRRSNEQQQQQQQQVAAPEPSGAARRISSPSGAQGQKSTSGCQNSISATGAPARRLPELPAEATGGRRAALGEPESASEPGVAAPSARRLADPMARNNNHLLLATSRRDDAQAQGSTSTAAATSRINRWPVEEIQIEPPSDQVRRSEGRNGANRLPVPNGRRRNGSDLEPGEGEGEDELVLSAHHEPAERQTEPAGMAGRTGGQPEEEPQGREEIRIVRQNCKLHHHHHHHSVHSLVKSKLIPGEMFPPIARPPVEAAAACKRLQAAKRRQLGPECLVQGNRLLRGARHSAPYVSMDNLAGGKPTSLVRVAPNFATTQTTTTIRLPPRPQSRQERACLVDPRAEPDGNHLPARMYRRSTSALGQNGSTCCLQTAGDTFAEPSACACQIRPTPVQRFSRRQLHCAQTLAMSKFKARSEDKLNLMNINPSYVRLASSKPPNGHPLAGAKLRPQNLRRLHLLPACCAGSVTTKQVPLVCLHQTARAASSSRAPNRGQQQVFNYSTATGMISSLTPATSGWPASRKLAAQTCCRPSQPAAAAAAIGHQFGYATAAGSGHCQRLDYNGNEPQISSRWPAYAPCCPQAGCCQPQLACQAGKHRKYSLQTGRLQPPDCRQLEGPSSNGASTDSSGYQSAGERRRPASPARLLRMCPLASRSGSGAECSLTAASVSELAPGSQRRPRVSTFLSSPMAGGQLVKSAPRVTKNLHSSDISPTTCSTPSPLSSSPPSSSPCSPPVVTKQQQHRRLQVAAPARPAATSGPRTSNQGLGLGSIPRPPPMPSDELELGELTLARTSSRRSATVVAAAAEGQDSLEDRQVVEDGSGGGKSNRLCFVDELKLMARRQKQQQQQQQQQPVANGSHSSSPSAGSDAQATGGERPTDSSTLIRIINASKSSQQQQAVGKRAKSTGCACCKLPADSSAEQRQRKCAECGSSRTPPNLKCSASGCHKSAGQQQAPVGPKSVKLRDEQDNMRRQHGK